MNARDIGYKSVYITLQADEKIYNNFIRKHKKKL